MCIALASQYDNLPQIMACLIWGDPISVLNHEWVWCTPSMLVELLLGREDGTLCDSRGNEIGGGVRLSV